MMRAMYTIYISRRGKFVIMLGEEEKRQLLFLGDYNYFAKACP